MMHRSKKPLRSGVREYFNQKRPVNTRVDGTAPRLFHRTRVFWRRSLGTPHPCNVRMDDSHGPYQRFLFRQKINLDWLTKSRGIWKTPSGAAWPSSKSQIVEERCTSSHPVIGVRQDTNQEVGLPFARRFGDAREHDP